MKLNDILPITKTKYTIGLSKNQFYKGRKAIFDEKGEEHLWFSQADFDFVKKNGYLVRGISAHSKYKSWLRNNYEKDIVIAYIDTIFAKIFLLKARGGEYKIFSYINTSDLGLDGICNDDILRKYENLLKVIDNDEWEKYNKLKILEKLK